MRAVGQVTSDHAHLHTALLDVRQMFHTLHVYGIQVPEHDHDQLQRTSERLEELHSSAIIVQKSVQPVQAHYLTITQEKVAQFSVSVRDFHQRFDTEGPGAVGDDLAKGLMLLKEYSDEIATLLKHRQTLDEEEDVFDLAATQYPGLDDAVIVMKQLRDVFTIYNQLRVR
ncbi:dynein axonemal heavy chain 10-like [Panulirus ornatus]|uniref:dynein axonemal heavy chain 10-like n=1 Tax=Panulirus ornatus TaxID=150431 RepID=UPI003A8C2651